MSSKTEILTQLIDENIIFKKCARLIIFIAESNKIEDMVFRKHIKDEAISLRTNLIELGIYKPNKTQKGDTKT